MLAERKIYNVMMSACAEGRVPDGHYGPTTVRWATDEEREGLGLDDFPLVHLDVEGKVDCYFTETEAVVVGVRQ